MNEKRYSPTMVKRYVTTPGNQQQLIDTYLDATVRDQGQGGWLRAQEAMLRAYPDSEERMKEWDRHEEWFVVERKDHIKYYGEDMRGYVLDCDGDLALNRVMGVVLAKNSYGHGNEEWVMLIAHDSEHDEWSGFGYDDNPQYRIERWVVTIHKEEEKG